MAHVALQVPATLRRPRDRRRAVRRGGPPPRGWPSTSGRSTTREMERLLDLGVDGIISDLPTPLVGVLEAGARVAWRGGGT